MFNFSQPIIALIELSERWMQDNSLKEDLLLTLKTVTNINEMELNGFKFFTQGVKKTTNFLNIIEEINQAYKLREELLEQMGSAIKKDEHKNLDTLLNQLEEATIIITQASEALAVEDQKLHLSKNTSLNNFLQACLNVYADTEPAEVLPPRVAMAINLVNTMEQDFNNFIEIRPQAVPWQPYFIETINKMKEGIGGIQVFLDEHNPQNLIAGATMIQEASSSISSLMQDMFEKTQGLYTFSFVNEIERLWIRRYHMKEGTIQQEQLDEALQAVDRLVSFHESICENFKDSPISESIKVYYEQPLEQMVVHERECLNKLSDDDNTLILLKDAVEKYINTNSSISDYVRQTIPNISEASNMNELRKLILGVYEGRTPVRILKRVASYLKEQLEQNKLAEEGSENAVNLQEQGLAKIEEFLITRNRELLNDSLELLQNGTILMLDYYNEKNKKLIDSASKQGSIACMKCGYINKNGVTYCENCRSYLLLARTIIDSETHLINYSNDGELDVEKPDNIKKLEELAASINYSQESESGPIDVKEVIIPILLHTNSVLDFFKNRPADSASKDEMNPAEFIKTTELYKSGLEKFLEYDKDNDKAKVQQAMEIIRNATEAFMQIKTKTAKS